jgi:hypothetical protein
MNLIKGMRLKIVKVKVSYRLEDKTINRAKKMADFYSLHSPVRDDLPGQKKKTTVTDVVEFALNAAYDKLIEEGYTL